MSLAEKIHEEIYHRQWVSRPLSIAEIQEILDTEPFPGYTYIAKVPANCTPGQGDLTLNVDGELHYYKKNK